MKVNQRKKGKKDELKNSTRIRLPGDYAWKVLDRMILDLSQHLDIMDYGKIRAACCSRSLDSLSHLFDAWDLQCEEYQIGVSLFELRAKHQLASLLKKYLFEGISPQVRQDNAFKKFILGEIVCRQFNKVGINQLLKPGNEELVRVFTYARAWIQKVIGYELPEFDQLTLRSRHGPGASSNTVKGNTSSYFKYKEWPYDCTRRSFRMAVAAIQADKRWLGVLEEDYRKRFNIDPCLILNQETFWDNVINIVPGNKIAFVPKSYKIDRTIAIEPTMNLYLQLGVDGFIRRRLKRWSIDLDTQEKNRLLAQVGSVSDDYATIDLSMASDTISKSLVRFLLPQPWYDHLMSLASHSGKVGDREFIYEKISSMGNGFTFALESLIFAAITYAVNKNENESGHVNMDEMAVYGDDIIVKKDCALPLIRALKAAGFTINLDKSFLKGFIKESCGADWFHGLPIRPMQIKRLPCDVKELFNDFNRIKRIFALHFSLAESESRTLELLRSWIPVKFKTFTGPLSNQEFDTYLHTENFGNHVYSGWIWRFQRLVRVPNKLNYTHFGYTKLLARLSDLPADRYVPWHIRKLDGKGSVFEVIRNNSWRFAISPSATSNWWQDYTSAD